MTDVLRAVEDFYLLHLDNDLVSPRVFSLGVVSFVGLLVLLVLMKLLRRRSVPARDSVLLIGHCGSGKTALLARLLGSNKTTLTSTRESVIDVPIGDGSVRVCDLPGHPRILPACVARLQDRAAALVFMIDSAAFASEARLVAEVFFDVLTNPVFSKQKLPVLVLCNKTDLPGAAPIATIQTTLEVEIDKIRKTRVSGPGYQGGDGKLLQQDKQVFELRHLKQPVRFVACSVKQGSCNQQSNFDLLDAFLRNRKLPRAANE